MLYLAVPEQLNLIVQRSSWTAASRSWHMRIAAADWMGETPGTHASVMHGCRPCCNAGDRGEDKPASAQVLVDGHDAGEVQRVAHLAQQR